MPGTVVMTAATESAGRVWAIAHHPMANPNTATQAATTRPHFMASLLLCPRFPNGGHSLRHDQVDAKLAQCRARSRRIAGPAVAGTMSAQPIGPHQRRIDRHRQRGVGDPGMVADLGIAQ